jgi:hypothetical protein
LPDLMFIPLAAQKPTFLELKSKGGHASNAQKQIRAELVPVGCQWWMARSVPAALEALRRAGVPFRLPWSKAVHLQPWGAPLPIPRFACRNIPTCARGGVSRTIDTASGCGMVRFGQRG